MIHYITDYDDAITACITQATKEQGTTCLNCGGRIIWSEQWERWTHDTGQPKGTLDSLCELDEHGYTHIAEPRKITA